MKSFLEYVSEDIINKFGYDLYQNLRAAAVPIRSNGQDSRLFLSI